MKEIGSEFWDVCCGEKTNNFKEDTQWFLSGRIALKAIIRDIKSRHKISSVSLPDWCCESQIIPFVEEGIQVVFYEALKPIPKISTDVLMVMDYFGYSSKPSFRAFKGIVIRDITHSIFSKEYADADYYFGSLRKWDGFWTGGFAWGFENRPLYSIDDLGYTELREKAMRQKSNYISNLKLSFNDNMGDKAYLSLFSEAEHLLERLDVLPASIRDMEMAQRLDIDFLKQKRRKNAKILLDAFSDIAIFRELGDDDCPLFVPIKVENRNNLRKYLIQKQIYCPVHWPISSYHEVSESSRSIYDSELSLICDHRYSEEDMERIVKTVHQFIEES